MPRSRGGSHGHQNLAFSCEGCNNRKGAETAALDPVTDLLVPLFNPRTQRWHDHFEWTQAGTIVEGRTATARATVGLLQLNRPALVNLRWLLAQVGLHPPSRKR